MKRTDIIRVSRQRSKNTSSDFGDMEKNAAKTEWKSFAQAVLPKYHLLPDLNTYNYSQH